MSKVINITEKLSNEKPVIVIGEKSYEVNDGLETVLKFEELVSDSTAENMVKAIEISLGEQAAIDLNIMKMNASNYKVLAIAILASMQGVTYEEAEGRFRKA